MKYRALKKYNSAPDNPIEITKGEELLIFEESDPHGDWPNWLFCKGENKEGWVPKQIITIEGSKGISSENYTAIEMNLTLGDVIISSRELNGWIWGTKENEPDLFSWAPLDCLEVIY